MYKVDLNFHPDIKKYRVFMKRLDSGVSVGLVFTGNSNQGRSLRKALDRNWNSATEL